MIGVEETVVPGIGRRLAWRTAARRGAVACGLIVTFLVSGELAARVDDRIRLGIPLLATPDHDHDLVIHDGGPIRGRPNGRYKKWQLNSFGFRSPEMRPSPRPGCPRVLVLGASETFGLYESDDHEYPAQLRGILRRVGCYETINAALFGLTVRRITRLWTDWAAQFGPEIAIIYPTPAFYLSDQPPGEPQADAPPEDDPVPWRPRLLDRAHNVLHYPSFVQRWRVRRWLAADRAGHADSWFFDRAPEDRLELFLADLGGLVDAIKARGAVPVLVTHATAFHRPPLADEMAELEAWNLFVPRARASALLQFEDATADGILQLAARRGVPVVDAASVMNGHREWFAEDFIHFSDEGAGVIARLLAGRIAVETPGAARAAASQGADALQ